MKKLFYFLLFLILILSGCSHVKTDTDDTGKLQILSTAFVPYDFVREIAGEKVEVSMLIDPGVDTHSYEPSPKDIIEIAACDLFIYVGGESDKWVRDILKTAPDGLTAFPLMDHISPVEEKIVEGMQSEDHHHEKTFDEHVWTAPQNAIAIVNSLTETLCSLDNENSEFYKTNAEKYVEKLQTLHLEFKDVVEKGKRRTFVVADRFPLMYFAEAYNLDYYAAFPGCTFESEPSAHTVAFLIDKVKEEEIPVVFHIEMSNQKLADTVCAATGAKKQLFSSCHNISKEDFDAGKTYLLLMENNLQALKEALN